MTRVRYSTENCKPWKLSKLLSLLSRNLQARREIIRPKYKKKKKTNITITIKLAQVRSGSNSRKVMTFIWDDLKEATFETGAKAQVQMKKPGTSGQESLFLILPSSLTIPPWSHSWIVFLPMHKNCYLTAFHSWPTSLLVSLSVEFSQTPTSCMPLTLKCKPHILSFPQAPDPVIQECLGCLLRPPGTSNMS